MIPPFPVQEETVLQRSSVFNDTPTFGNYVCLLGRCCFFLRFPTTWKTSCVAHVARGLRKFQDHSFRFSNFIRIPLILKSLNMIHAEANLPKRPSLFYSP